MIQIELVKKYPYIKDEDVVNIFLEGYLKGFENARKRAITIEWIEKWTRQFYDKNGRYNGEGYDSVWDLLEDWKKENGTV